MWVYSPTTSAGINAAPDMRIEAFREASGVAVSRALEKMGGGM